MVRYFCVSYKPHVFHQRFWRSQYLNIHLWRRNTISPLTDFTEWRIIFDRLADCSFVTVHNIILPSSRINRFRVISGFCSVYNDGNALPVARGRRKLEYICHHSFGLYRLLKVAHWRFVSISAVQKLFEVLLGSNLQKGVTFWMHCGNGSNKFSCYWSSRLEAHCFANSGRSCCHVCSVWPSRLPETKTEVK